MGWSGGSIQGGEDAPFAQRPRCVCKGVGSQQQQLWGQGLAAETEAGTGAHNNQPTIGSDSIRNGVRGGGSGNGGSRGSGSGDGGSGSNGGGEDGGSSDGGT